MRTRFNYTDGTARLTDRDGYFISGSRRERAYSVLLRAKGNKLPVKTYMQRITRFLKDDDEAHTIARQLHKLGYIRLGSNPNHGDVAKHTDGFTC